MLYIDTFFLFDPVCMRTRAESLGNCVKVLDKMTNKFITTT